MDNSTEEWPPKDKRQMSFIIGLSLAISSSLFIGTSFIIKKLSLIRLGRLGALRAGSGGFGYLKDWMWWFGFLTMGLGELANFVAYTFAPASLVTPLGALSILVSALLASKCLNENLNTLGKIGCLLCILGSVILIIHAPKEQDVSSIEELIEKLHNPLFQNYIIIVIVVTILIMFYLGPKLGNKHVVIYITVCSGIGSLTVMACKGLGLAVQEAIQAQKSRDLSIWAAYTLLGTVVICIIIQMNYLNKALDLFNTSVVTPVYYVMFTSLVILASAILFDEWSLMSLDNILGSACGFFVIIVAIFMLQSKDSEDSRFKHQKLGLLKNGYSNVTNYS